jgi:hypothetical protein
VHALVNNAAVSPKDASVHKRRLDSLSTDLDLWR